MINIKLPKTVYKLSGANKLTLLSQKPLFTKY